MILLVLLVVLDVVSRALAAPSPHDEPGARHHNELGIAAFGRKDYEAAREEFLAAYRANPGENALLFSIALTYRAVNEDEQAILYLEKYVEFEPTGLYVGEARSQILELWEAIAAREAREEGDRQVAEEGTRQRSDEIARQEDARRRADAEAARRLLATETTGSGLRTGGIVLAATGVAAMAASAALVAHDGGLGEDAVVTGIGGAAAVIAGGVSYYLGTKARAEARAGVTSIVVPSVSTHGLTVDWAGSF
jgi:tetratricopeptide (TPR) repeat protein